MPSSQQQAIDRFELIAKATHDAIWDWDLVNNTTWWNEGFRELFGYQEEEIEAGPESWYNRIHPDDRDRILESIHAVIDKAGKSWQGEYRFLKADGSYAYVLDRGYTIRKNGKAIRMVGSMLDFTEHKRLQEQRQESEERMHFAMQAAGLGSWDLDIVNNTINWDERCQELFGFSKGSTKAYANLFDFIHPDDAERVKEAITWALNPHSGGHYDIEYRSIGEADKRKRWLRCKGKAYFTPEEVAYRFAGIVQDITPEVQARKEQQKLTHIVETSDDCMVLSDAEGSLVYMNDAGLSLTGLRKTAVTTTTFTTLFNAATLQEEVWPAINKAGKWSGLLTLKHVVTGEFIPCYAKLVRIDSPVASSTLAIGCTLRDLREEIAARKELQASEERFRSFVLNAPTPIGIYVGREMRIQIANNAILETWGKDASVIGKTFREALPELDGTPFHQLLDDVYTTGISYHTPESEVVLFRDGRLETLYFTFTYAPLRNSNGLVYAVMNTATDITALVHARQKLKEAEENLAMAVEIAELGTWQLKLQTGQAFFSDRIKNWLGFESADELSFAEALQCIPDADLLQQAIEKAIQQPDGIIDVEYRVKHRLTGQQRIMHSQGRVFFNEQGEAYLVTGTSQDITAQRNNEQELERMVQLRTEELKQANMRLQEINQHLVQSNQELEQFAYIASHDLQEPLRKIKTFGSLLQEHMKKIEDTHVHNYLNKIMSSSGRMSNLIQDLLNFSRISAKEELFTTVDLNVIMANICEDFELLIRQKEARLQVARLPVIEAIPLHMNQLFYNLLGNALKFSREEEPPNIVIDCKKATPQQVEKHASLNPDYTYCFITISDNGIGFEPHLTTKIFTIFQRLHVRSKYEGTGIGLALCKKIVVAHGGEIWAEAQENKGATFSLLLPVKHVS